MKGDDPTLWVGLTDLLQETGLRMEEIPDGGGLRVEMVHRRQPIRGQPPTAESTLRLHVYSPEHLMDVAVLAGRVAARVISARAGSRDEEEDG